MALTRCAFVVVAAAGAAAQTVITSVSVGPPPPPLAYSSFGMLQVRGLPSGAVGLLGGRGRGGGGGLVRLRVVRHLFVDAVDDGEMLPVRATCVWCDCEDRVGLTCVMSMEPTPKSPQPERSIAATSNRCSSRLRAHAAVPAVTAEHPAKFAAHASAAIAGVWGRAI